jgi:hypothetical protein
MATKQSLLALVLLAAAVCALVPSASAVTNFETCSE